MSKIVANLHPLNLVLDSNTDHKKETLCIFPTVIANFKNDNSYFKYA